MKKSLIYQLLGTSFWIEDIVCVEICPKTAKHYTIFDFTRIVQIVQITRMCSAFFKREK